MNQPSYRAFKPRHLLSTVPIGTWRKAVLSYVMSGYSWTDACHEAYVQLFHIELPQPLVRSAPPGTSVHWFYVSSRELPAVRPVAPYVQHNPPGPAASPPNGATVKVPSMRLPVLDAAHNDATVEVPATETSEARSGPFTASGEMIPLARVPTLALYPATPWTPTVPPEEPTEKYPALAALRHSA